MHGLTFLVAWLLFASVGASAAPALHGVDQAAIDPAVTAGDDFFRYANGHWLKTVEVPPDRSSFGLGAMLTEEASARIRELIVQAAATPAPAGSDEQLVGDFYKAYMDQAAIDARGLSGVSGRLARIAAISDRRGLSESLGQTLITDVDPLNNTNLHTAHLLGLWVAQDFNRPDRNIVYLLQGGLGMPDREYYLDASPRMTEIRARYRAHVAAMLKLAGMADADAKAAMVLDLETKIAKVHETRASSEEVLKANNPWTRADFDAKAPGLDWDALFKASGLGGQSDFIVWQPAAVAGEARLVASEPLDAWKAWLSVMVLDQFADVLPKPFADEHFAFFGQVLSGTPQQPERWKRAIEAANTALGDAVGRMYVKQYFPARSKAEIETMVANIKAAFGRRIDHLAWMTPQTKGRAKQKLATLYVGVGYPQTFIDYTGLKIVPDDALEDVYLGDRAQFARHLHKLGVPVDQTEWWMTPQTVNAVNLPIQNALNFPAAILQPPYFDPEADPAVNYGAIGAIIGHEISHSFDNDGALFDSHGRMRNWWTKADFDHFDASGKGLAKQYDAYCPFADLCVNGEQTLSENIADVAGLSASYDAWKMSLGGKPAPVVDGLTGDQQFFIAFAQAWRSKVREPALRQQLLTNGHAPSADRAQTVRNIDGWYPAFNVSPGEKLYLTPDQRARIW